MTVSKKPTKAAHEPAGASRSLAEASEGAAQEIDRLRSDLEQLAAQMDALRRAKSVSDAAAGEEFRMRLQMERDILLADSRERALAAANRDLRSQLDAEGARAERMPQLMASLDRALERERAAHGQMAHLREALEQADATIEALQAERGELLERLAVQMETGAKRGWPWRSARRVAEGGDEP